MLVVVIALSVLRDIREAVIVGFAAGLLLDLMTPVSFGIFSVSFLFIALLASVWQGKFSHSFSYLLPVFLVLPYTIVFNVCVSILLQLSGHPISWESVFRNVIIPVGLFNIVVMAVIYPVLYWLNRAFKKEAITI